MSKSDDQPTVVKKDEATAFTVWLRRALKSCHDDAMNEPLPRELLKLLPPSKQG